MSNSYATSFILDEYDEKNTRPGRTPPSPGGSTLHPRANPFSNQNAYSLPTTPRFGMSRRGSVNVPGTPHSQTTFVEKPRFRSRRYKKEEIQQPWLVNKDKKARWAWIFPYLGIFIGVALTVVQCYFGWVSVPKNEYCPVLMEDFSSGVLDPNVWQHEIALGGFGNGEFSMTTSDSENSFIKDGALYIKPTLQDQNLIDTDNLLDLGSACTYTSFHDCVATTNTTNGTIVNPVKSARLSTKMGPTIKYGKVEVVAKMPIGDWMWPAIWMLPVNSTYGVWPTSGEIDIAESRGNNRTYQLGGNNKFSSTLHWGPSSDLDRYARTSMDSWAARTTYAADFHTYGMEWSEKYIFTYIDDRLHQVLYIQFDEPFWKRGDFPAATANGTQLVDPWGQTGDKGTPFDQEFYLILNVAVGGSYFPDGVGGKPWVEGSALKAKQFWDAKNQWYPTWQEEGEMVVKSVKMYQQKGYNGCLM